jgi:hypothetical protein
MQTKRSFVFIATVDLKRERMRAATPKRTPEKALFFFCHPELVEGSPISPLASLAKPTASGSIYLRGRRIFHGEDSSEFLRGESKARGRRRGILEIPRQARDDNEEGARLSFKAALLGWPVPKEVSAPLLAG